MLRGEVFGLVLLLISFCNSKVIPKGDEVEGYHWRDYNGFLPHDAFSGGNENGEVTYIGQVLHNDLLIPAKIIQAEAKAYFEWESKELSTTENIKILCTDNPRQLRWLSSSNLAFKNITSKRLVKGGHETSTKPYYIARIDKEGEILLGRLGVADSVTLHIAQNGKSIESDEFEVLYYVSQEDEAVITSNGFYWRDYVGVIPHDALRAGVEGDQATYIALVLYDKLLVPGKIIENEKKAHFEWGLAAHTAKENIKIFCTDRPERFHWLSTTSAEFRQIKDKHFIIASNEKNGILYIGRMNDGDDKIVGKLLVNEEIYLHAAQGNRAVGSFVFDVLYYDPPANETE